jgi:hypothetical protein
MTLRTMIVAALVISSVGLSAQTRRSGRTGFDETTRSADEWCRDVERQNRRQTSCDVREESLARIASLDVDTGGNGSVHVRGTSGSNTRVRLRIVGYAESEPEARELVLGVRVSTDGGRIRPTGPRGRDGQWWSVSVDIETPRELPMTLTTRNGAIAIEDAAGRTRFDTTNGAISLSDVSGDVRGTTVNGAVHVELEGTRWQGDGLDVSTTNGRVFVLLPPDYNAELHTETSNGGIAIDFPITVHGRLTGLPRRLDATLGSGGPPLRVQTVNGGVSIGVR